MWRAPARCANPAHRWECLQATGASLADELAFTQRVAAENVKNYHLWNHKRKCAQALGAANAQSELEYAAAALEQVRGWGPGAPWLRTQPSS
jgi:hypothetical protein